MKPVNSVKTAAHQRFFALIAVDKKTAWFEKKATGWQIVPVSGEEWSPLEDDAAESIRYMISTLEKIINREDILKSVVLNFILDERAAESFVCVLPLLHEKFNRNWQVLRWEYLVKGVAAHQEAKSNDLLDLKWLQTSLLPALNAIAGQIELLADQFVTPEASQHQQVIERLHSEIHKLELQKAELQAHLESISAPSMEQLLTYLPAIFKDFWGSIRPDELSAIAGTFTVPEVPSPFSEPSAATVATMKKRFQKLPAQDQIRIIGFCRGLEHRLTVRAEMQELLGEY